MNGVGSETGRRRFKRNGWQLGGVVEQGVARSADTRRDGDAEQRAVGSDGGERECGAEVYDDTGRTVAAVRFHGVADEVASDFVYGGFGDFYRQERKYGRIYQNGLAAGQVFDQADELADKHGDNRAEYAGRDAGDADSGVTEKRGQNGAIFVAGAARVAENSPGVNQFVVVKERGDDVRISDIYG